MVDNKSKFQQAQTTPIRMNTNKSIPRHITFTLQKTKSRGEKLKRSYGK